MTRNRMLKDFDWLTLLLSLSLAGIGSLGIYSATREGAGTPALFVDHLTRLGIGFAVLCIVLLVDYRTLLRYAYVIFGACVGLLVAVEAVGRVGMGAQRWLAFGGFRIQPSELVKVALILFMARYFGSLKKKPPLSVRDVLPSAAAAAVPVILVLRQPDLGTAIIIAGVYVFMVFEAGLHVKVFAWAAAAAGAATAVLTTLAYTGLFNVLDLLRDYQVRRLKVLFNPDLDPLGAGYHINQSKIAIGSGGLAGKGFLKGTQTGLNFLPQQHTDFIFSVIAEEGGFMASTVVLALMAGLLLWGINTASKAQDKSGSLVAVGVVAVLFLHCAVNIGMTSGVFPVVGLPLPLMSYGGSSVLTSFVCLGLVMNVRMRRFVYY
jgi:rod shape determining protein RodA